MRLRRLAGSFGVSQLLARRGLGHQRMTRSCFDWHSLGRFGSELRRHPAESAAPEKGKGALV